MTFPLVVRVVSVPATTRVSTAPTTTASTAPAMLSRGTAFPLSTSVSPSPAHLGTTSSIVATPPTTTDPDTATTHARGAVDGPVFGADRQPDAPSSRHGSGMPTVPIAVGAVGGLGLAAWYVVRRMRALS